MSHNEVSFDPYHFDNERGKTICVKMEPSVNISDKHESINNEPLGVQFNKRIPRQGNQSSISTKKEGSSSDDESDSDIEMVLSHQENISGFSSGKRVSHKRQISDLVKQDQLPFKIHPYNSKN
ncbi:hypothetical protein RF11_04566 [Thelohanellus kitauei]|uniref:Uncharacterized protein n=1 Tax=Thelohanellus kitauei TaxID=669202 RepID=A0A0C2N3T3_THEKT|nr:hypothetical protein RF11_04566 [Thelohanellus kitauei]